MKKTTLFSLCMTMLLHSMLLVAAPACNDEGLWLQVLGSGGPEAGDGRASSGYLVWHKGRARLLVDMGAGSLLRLEQAQASLNDLDAIVMTHFHADHSNDLPALIKASFFTRRQRDLPLYGPTGNHLMPSATQFVQRLFDTEGAFHYLSGYVDGSERYQLVAHDVAAGRNEKMVGFDRERFRLSAIPVHHGPIPAIAWRVDIAGKSLVFSGDMSNEYDALRQLARQADIFIAHHAIPEQTNPVARNLHMPPSEIGRIAARAKVGQLVLSHRMLRTLGREAESLSLIREYYDGPVHFADDLQCFRISRE